MVVAEGAAEQSSSQRQRDPKAPAGGELDGLWGRDHASGGRQRDTRLQTERMNLQDEMTGSEL